jgi:hypothetical protein
MKQRIAITMAMTTLCFLAATQATAHDFEVKAKSGNILFFNITDSRNSQVELTYDGSIENTNARHYSGNLNVPKEVTYRGKTYAITAIGGMAFRNCTELESVKMSSNIKRIGNFAFQNCTKLKTVVLPTGQADIAQGAFFGCEAIDSVAIGGEWSEVDLLPFRWSKELKSLRLPAGMEKLSNLKKLTYLETVYVTADNLNFSSAGGALYNKKGTKLLGCPKAIKDKLVIKEGTIEIARGALADCRNITELDLPKTLQRMSFRELSFLTQLKTMTIRAEKPLETATDSEGKPCFIMKTASTKLIVCIAKNRKKEWSEAVSSQKAGNYSELDADKNALSYMVKDTELLTAEQISFVKF